MAQSTINVPAQNDRPPPLGNSNEYGDSWKEAMDKVNDNFDELYEGIPAGGGSETFAPAGTINVSLSQIGSSATNTTQTLISYTLPASTLNENGAALEVICWGSKAANAAPVTLQLNVGGASINSGSSTGSGFSWMMKATGGRRASNVQRYFFEGIRAALPLTASSTGDTSTDSSTMTISVQALDASAAQSNVLLDGLVIKFFKAS